MINGTPLEPGRRKYTDIRHSPVDLPAHATRGCCNNLSALEFAAQGLFNNSDRFESVSRCGSVPLHGARNNRL
jgi:hypothetical protein